MMLSNRSTVLQEEDRVRTPPVFAGLVALAIIGCGLVTWAWFALRANERAYGTGPYHPATAPAAATSMGGLYHTLIGTDTSMSAIRRRDAHLLNSWEWIDRERGIARVPIEAAMQAVTESAVR